MAGCGRRARRGAAHAGRRSPAAADLCADRTGQGRPYRSGGGEAFPIRAVTVPANSKVRLLIQRDAMVSAYPQLDVTGGAGSKVTVTWSEALYDANRKRATAR